MKYIFTLLTLATFFLVFVSTVSAASLHGREHVGSQYFNSANRMIKTNSSRKADTKATNSISASASISSAAPSSSTSSAAAAPGGSGTVYSGDGTWFNLGLGSCGQDNNDSQFVAAMNAPQMQNGANPNNNPMCGKDIKITNPANNKTVTVKIVDTCPPCASGSVDLSPAAFSNISDLDVGRIKIDWVFV